MAPSSKLILLSIFLIAFARSANVTTGDGTTIPPATGSTAPPAAGSSTVTPPVAGSSTTTPAAGTGTITPPATGSSTTTPPASGSSTTTPAAAGTGTTAPPVTTRPITAVRPAHYCLDGSDNSFVSFGTAVGNFAFRNFTVALWVQTSETLALFDIVGNHVASGRGTYFGIRMTGNNPTLPHGQVIVELDQNVTGVTRYQKLASTTSGLNDGKWHHITFVRAGRNLSLYIDGKLDSSLRTPGVDGIVTPNDFKIGRSEDASAGKTFSPVACYGDLRVTWRAISAAEVANLFKTSTH